MPVDYDPEQTHKDIDHGIDDTRDHVNDGHNAANDTGKADQSAQQAKQDYQDNDQDAQDKARNMEHDGTDGMRHGGDALDDLGLHGLGRDVDGLANDLDKASDFLGKRQPTDASGNPILPDVHLHLYFGKEGALDAIEGGLKKGLMDQADSLIGSAAKAVGLGGFANHAVSSFLDDDTSPDRGPDVPCWNVVDFDIQEGLDQLFRVELLVARNEVPSPYTKAAQSPGGGLLDQIIGPVQDAMSFANKAKGLVTNAVSTVEGLFSNPKSALDLLSGGSRPPDPAGPTPYINVPLDPGEMLGKPVSLAVVRHMDDPERYPYTRRWVTGIVWEMHDLGVYRGKNATQDIRVMRLVIVPELQRLSLRKNCRVFQDQTTIAIIREVLREGYVYGMLPDLPGVGAVTDFASGLASHIPGPIGGAASDALSGEFVKTMPPDGLSEQEWTPKRELCIQWDETDLAFLMRLLQEEGISFYFLQEKGGEKLVLCDDPTRLDKCKTIDGRGVPYGWPYDRTVPTVEIAWGLRQTARLTSNAVSLRDYCFSENAPTEMTAKAAGGALEVYEYPAYAQYQPDNDGAGPQYRVPYNARFPAKCTDKQDRDLAKLRLQEIQANAYVGTVSTNLSCARPGTTIRLKGILLPEITFDRLQQGGDVELPTEHTFLVRAVRHRASRAGESFARGYVNDLEVQWVHDDPQQRIAYRPARVTPRPIIHGLQSATVVQDKGRDSDDDRIHLDHPTLGRVRVRFHWDRRGENPLHVNLPLVSLGKTAWVRVAQNWAGPDYGVTFLPRVGMEVLVSFLEGDPDRPLIVGAVYNGLNPPPFDKPELSGIRTLTNPCKDDETDGNELRFDDTVDKEIIAIHASRFLIKEVRQNHETTVEHNQKNDITRHHGEIVELKQKLHVEKDRQKTIEKDELTTISGHRAETIKGNNTQVITTNRKETVKGKEVLVIGKQEALDPNNAARTLAVFGDRVTEIGTMPDSKLAKDVTSETHANDYLDVRMSKKDHIVGDFLVTAGSLGVAQPSGERADHDQAGFSVEPGEHASTVSLTAEKRVDMEAKGKVTIQSEHRGVTFSATQGSGLSIHIKQNGNDLSLFTRGPDDTISLLSDKKVAIESMHTTLARFEPGKAVLLSDGHPSAAISIENGEVELSGESLAVSMRENIDLDASGGVHFAKGEPPPLDASSFWDEWHDDAKEP